MRTSFLILCLLLSSHLAAQVITFSLPEEITTSKLELPFTLNLLRLAQTGNDTLAIFDVKKNKAPLVLMLGKQTVGSFSALLKSNYQSAKLEPVFELYITQLQLSHSPAEAVDSKDTFLFQCEFRGQGPFADTVFYTFSANARWGNYKHAEQVFTNYVRQALLTAVEKFTFAYRENQGWNNIFNTIQKGFHMPVIVTVTKNIFQQHEDSLACEKNYHLKWTDFRPYEKSFSHSAKPKTDTGSAKFILNYRPLALEKNDTMFLQVYVNAFLLLHNSWRPTDTLKSNWLQHQQGYYDICTLYGDKLAKDIRNYTFSAGAYRAELNQLYNKQLADFNTLCAKYEKETEGGRNENKKLVWKEIIKEMLLANSD